MTSPGFCGNCGTTLTGTPFCANCGQPVQASTSQQTAAKQTSSSPANSSTLLVLGAVVVIALVAGAYFLGKSGGGDKSANSSSAQNASGNGAPNTSSGSGGNSNNSAVTKFANQYVLTLMNTVFGYTDPQQLINMFDSSCRQSVSVEDIQSFVQLVKGVVTNSDKLDDVDLGKLDIQKTAGGYNVKPTDTTSERFKVKGQFVKADDYFSKVDMGTADEKPWNDGLKINENKGSLVIGDCTALDNFSP